MPEGSVIDPAPPPAPALERDTRGKVTCEFCECELGRSGEYKSLSEKAKKLRKLADDNEKLEGELATARTEREDWKRKYDALTTAPKSETRKGGLLI
jgi:hypothetical protein